jgi:transcription antitermination factor NusA-like protein
MSTTEDTHATNERIHAAFREAVPELVEGLVTLRVVSASGPLGLRVKAVAASSDPDIDPVGACVGMKGSRVLEVLRTVGGTIDLLDAPARGEVGERYVRSVLRPLQVGALSIAEDAIRVSEVVLHRPADRDRPPAALAADAALVEPAILRAAVAVELALAGEVLGRAIEMTGEPSLVTG